MAGIPQVITSDRASSAQVIDGSLKFESDKKNYLSRTPSSTGDVDKWTWAGWVKRASFGSHTDFFSAVQSGGNATIIQFDNNDKLDFENFVGNSDKGRKITTQVFRDIGWYHIVVVYDSANSTADDRIILYVNGSRITSFSTSTNPDSGQDSIVNAQYPHYVGSDRGFNNHYFDGRLSNVYLIDGQALDASYFGYTDGLTNTWKPKKYEGTFGTNGFYLPLDGSAPIGQDQSGKGNNYTPGNFGGSLELDNPNVSGARPILNTTQGGSKAGVGVFGSKQNVGYAVTVGPKTGGGNAYYIDGVERPTLTGLIRGATYTFDTSDSTVGSTHPFRLSATSAHGTEYTNGVAAITGAATTITIPHDAPESLYYYCTAHSGMGSSITGITTNEKLADQYAWKCTLALPLVGGVGDVSPSIACTASSKTTSSDNLTFVGPGDMFYGNNNSTFTGDGSSNSRVTFPAGSLPFGTGDFTIEFWAHLTATGDQGNRNARILTAQSESGTYVQILSSTTTGKFQFKYNSGEPANISINNNLVEDRTRHFVYQRTGTTGQLIVDGVLYDTGTDNSDYADVAYQLGRYDASNGGASLHMADFRVYSGIQKYSTTGKSVGDKIFNPPSPSPDILPDTPSGVSGGSKLTKVTDGSVAFDGTGDDLHIADSADFEFGTGDFTIECFAYHTVDSDDHLISKYGSSNATRSWRLVSDGNRKIIFYWYYSTDSSLNITSAAGKFSLNRWHHIVAQRTSGDIYLFVDGELIGSNTSSGAAAEFNDNSTAVAIAGDLNGSSQDFPGFISNVRIVKGTGVYSTLGFTPPTAPLTNVTNTKLLCCQSNTSAGAAAVSPSISGLNNGTVWSDYLTTTQGTDPRDFYTAYNYPASNLFDGDTSSIVYGGWIDDSDDASDLIFSPPSGISVSSKLEVYVGYYSKIKVNGSDYNTGGQSTAQAWVTVSDGSNFTGTLTELILENTSNANVVRAAAIRIDDSTILLDPVSANGDAAATNFNPFNTDINTVRGQETSYPTLNPLSVSGLSGNRTSSTLSNGNLTSTNPGSNAWNCRLATVGVDSGKWYYEYTVNGTITNFLGGWADSPNLNWTDAVGNTSRSYGYYNTGNVRNSNNNTSFGATYTVGDVVGCAIDLDSYKIYWSKNGVWQNNAVPAAGTGSIYTVSSGYQYFPAVSTYDSNSSVTVNFGQNPFRFLPPDGFQPLNGTNLIPETVISRPDQYVGVTTYLGSSGNVVVDNLNHKPDAVIIKQENAGGGTNDWVMVDSVRGRAKSLYPSENYSQNTSAADKDLISFDKSGFTVGQTNQSAVNRGSSSYVYLAFAWKAGGGTGAGGEFWIDDVQYASAAAAGLTAGTITPTGASIGTKQGFSIIKYEGNGTSGATFQHGLTQAPDFAIVKNMEETEAWGVYHSAEGGARYAFLNVDNAFDASSALWNNTDPTSSVFTLGDYNGTNKSTIDFIAYLWHDVPGLQKFGMFKSNANNNGPYIELGFRPAFVWVKTADAADNWAVSDQARAPFNPSDKHIRLNAPDAAVDDSGNYKIDYLSSGFKIRGTNGEYNANAGNDYVYMAWAEAPTIDLFGGGANAR